MPYKDVKHLQVLTEYCEALGITNIHQLRDHTPTNLEAATSGTNATPVRLNMITVVQVAQHQDDHNEAEEVIRIIKALEYGQSGSEKPLSPSHVHFLNASSLHFTMIDIAHSINEYTAGDGICWEAYAQRFSAWLTNPMHETYPGNPPEGYYEVYKDHQKFTPGPHEYAYLVGSIFMVPHALAALPSNNGMVTLPPEAFTAVLNLQSGTKGQLLQMLTTDHAHDDASHGLASFTQRGGTYLGCGGFHGGYGGCGGRYGGCSGRMTGHGGYARHGGWFGGCGAYVGGSLAAHVEGQAAAKKKKARFQKHKGAQAVDSEMDECKSLSPEDERQFFQCFASLMSSFGTLDLAKDDETGEQEARPSRQGEDETLDKEEPLIQEAEYNEEAAGFYNSS